MMRLSQVFVLGVAMISFLFGITSVLAQDGEQHPVITPENADQLIQLAQLGRGEVRDLGWSPDGATLAIAGRDIWLYDTNDFVVPPQTLEGGSYYSVAFNADGTLLAAGDHGGAVSIWDMGTGEMIAQLKSRDGTMFEQVDRVAFSPDGNLLAALNFSLNVAWVWHIEDIRTDTDSPWVERLGGSVWDIAFSPDGSLIARAQFDWHEDGSKYLVYLSDTETLTDIMVLDGHTDFLTSVAFSSDGSMVASTSLDSTARVWDVQTGEQATVIEHTDNVFRVSFHPDGNQLATSSGGGDVQLWDLSTGEEIRALDVGLPARRLTYSPDGSLLAFAGYGGAVRAWNATTGQAVLRIDGHSGRISDLAFSPDDGILASAGEDGIVIFWNPATFEARAVLHPDLIGENRDITVSNIVFSSDGSQIAYATSSLQGRYAIRHRWIGIADLPVTQRLSPLWLDDGGGNLALSPDGARLASGGGDGIVRLIDVGTGEVTVLTQDEVATVSDLGHVDRVTDLAFSPDGSTIVSVHSGIFIESEWIQDASIQVWNVASGERVAQYAHQNGWVLDILFDADGTPSAIVSSEDTIDVWTPSTGESRNLFVQPELWTSWRVVLSPDRTLLAGVGSDGYIRLWNFETGEELVVLEGNPMRLARLRLVRMVRCWQRPELIVLSAFGAYHSIGSIVIG